MQNAENQNGTLKSGFGGLGEDLVLDERGRGLPTYPILIQYLPNTYPIKRGKKRSWWQRRRGGGPRLAGSRVANAGTQGPSVAGAEARGPTLISTSFNSTKLNTPSLTHILLSRFFNI